MGKYLDIHVPLIGGTIHGAFGSCNWAKLYGLHLKTGDHYEQDQEHPCFMKLVAEDVQLKMASWLSRYCEMPDDNYLLNQVFINCIQGKFLGITLDGRLYYYETKDGQRTPLSDKANLKNEPLFLGYIPALIPLHFGDDMTRRLVYSWRAWLEEAKQQTLKSIGMIGLDNPRIVFEKGIPDQIAWDDLRMGALEGINYQYRIYPEPRETMEPWA